MADVNLEWQFRENKWAADEITLVLVALACAAGAVWTAYWSLRFGLAPRSPLSTLQTRLRFVVVSAAIIRFPIRRDLLERTTLLCAIIAAGSSGLFGLGFRSTTLDVNRLLLHFVAYMLGFVASVRWLTANVMVRIRAPDPDR